MVMCGNLYSLNEAHKSAREDAKVQELAQLIGERLMGANWNSLGQDVALQTDHNAWSWHRRATAMPAGFWVLGQKKSPVNLPLEENPSPADANRNLISLGLVSGQTGIKNLKVYLEYYQMDVAGNVMENVRNSVINGKTPREAWAIECGDPVMGTAPTTTTNIFVPESVLDMNLSRINPAVVMRVLIKWDPITGGTRWHELVLARRK